MTPAPDAENNTRISQLEGEDECGPYDAEDRIPLVEFERMSRQKMLQNSNIDSSDLPSYPRYVTFEERLRSYKDWPAGTGVSPEALSVAGLFYSSQGDRTFCFQCGGMLEGWCCSDIPLNEHVKWYPSCKFVSSIRENMIIDDSYVTEFRKNARVEEDMKAALKTIRDLVSTIDINKVNPREMQSAIETLKVIVSEVDSNNGNSRIQEQFEDNIDDHSSASPEIMESSSSNNQKSSISCVICLTGPRNALLLPCHHIATCSTCASKLKNCCVCRLPVTYHTKVYIS